MFVVEILAFLPALAAHGLIRAPLPKVSESTNLFFPWSLFWRDEVRAGRLPFWNPFAFAGMPMSAEPQAQTFYPAHLLSLALAPETAFTLLFLLHVLLASWLMYRLAREFGTTRFGGAIAALVFGLQGQMVGFTYEGWIHQVAPMAWAPGVVWLLCRAYADWRVLPSGPIAAAALLLGVQIVSGHPEWVRYTLFILAFLILFGGVFGRGLINRLMIGGSIVVIGLLIGGVQLVPLAEATTHSARGQTALAADAAVRTGAGLPLLSLPTILAPRLFGPWDGTISADGLVHKLSGSLVSFSESMIFVGVVPLALAFIGWRFARRAGSGLWTLIAAAGVLFALNDWTHLLSFVDQFVPLDTTFRSPARFVFLTNFALAVLAGLGASRLDRAGATTMRLSRLARRLAVWLAGATVLVWLLRRVIVAAFVRWLHVPAVVAADPRVSADGGRSLGVWAIDHAALALIPTIAMLLVASVLLPRAARRLNLATAAALFVAIALDLGIYAYPLLTSVVPATAAYADDARLLDALASRADMRVGATHLGVFEAGDNATIAIKVRSTIGYDSFTVNEWDRLFRVMSHASPDVLAAIGVTHLASGAKPGVATLQALPNARAHAWWTGTAYSAATADQAAELLPRLARAGVVLESASAAKPPPTAPAASDDAAARVSIDRDVPGALQATVDAPRAGWLVFSEISYPGWTATVNGKRTDIARAFGALQAVPLAAGRSIVEMRFRPTIVAWGAAATLAGLLIAGALWRTGRGATPPVPEPPAADDADDDEDDDD